MDSQAVFFCGTVVALAIGAFILWGPSSYRRRRPGYIVGLINVGNTCFINTLLQALASCPHLIDWLLSKKRIPGSLADAVCTTIMVLNGQQPIEGEYYTPSIVLKSLKLHGWVISAGEHDAHELFHIIISALVDEVQATYFKVCVPGMIKWKKVHIKERSDNQAYTILESHRLQLHRGGGVSTTHEYEQCEVGQLSEEQHQELSGEIQQKNMGKLSSAEKQANYRKRLKEKGLYDEVRRKDAEAHKIKRSQLSERGKRLLRKKNRDYKRKERLLKKSNQDHSTNSEQTPSQSNILESPSKVFSTRQSYGKAKKRASVALPASPRKRRALIFDFARKEGLKVQGDGVSKAESSSASDSSELKTLIHNFYINDEVSWQAPGQRDHVTVWESGVKSVVQKRYLLTTLKGAYAIFCEKYQEGSVSFSKFAASRPKFVFLLRCIPQNVCVCMIHENVRLILCALRTCKLNVPLEFKQFIEQVVCNPESEACMSGECSNCPGLNSLILDKDPTELCKWNEWVTGDQVEKVERNGTVQDCLDVLREKLPQFLYHTFIKRKQHLAFNTRTSNLSTGDVVLQIDFSENFTCKEQDEIQSAHWNSTQITVFTAVAWFLNKYGEKTKLSFALLSDFLEHDKYAVHVYLSSITEKLKEHTTIENLHIFSDGAASHFKQKFTLCNITFLTDMGIRNVMWHYFATSHGKGAVDAIGGEVKRMARESVLAGRIQIKCAHDFFSFLTIEKRTKIHVIEVPAADINAVKPLLDERWYGIDAVPFTQKLHEVHVLGKYAIEYSKFSGSTDKAVHYFKKNECLQSDSSPVQQFETEKYYSVYYDEQFYIGRIISLDGDKVKIKFLHQSVNDFFWPRSDDIDIVDKRFVFYGPVHLSGSGPFQGVSISDALGESSNDRLFHLRGHAIGFNSVDVDTPEPSKTSAEAVVCRQIQEHKSVLPFRGLLTSQLKCIACKHKSPLLYDRFDSLSLSLPSLGGLLFKRLTLAHLLDNYVSTETVKGVECEGCSHDQKCSSAIKSTAVKTMAFGKLPKCLCFHIQRTTWQPNGEAVKRYDHVEFPEFLSMDPYTFSQVYKRKSLCEIGHSAQEGTKDGINERMSSSRARIRHLYRLVAIIVHTGGVQSGHFITYRRAPFREHCWYYASDHDVRESSLQEAMQACAYMLFYTKLNHCKSSSGPPVHL